MRCSICEHEMTDVEWGERHYYHDDDCPNYSRELKGVGKASNLVDCLCDNVCHAACCPVCNPVVPLDKNAVDIVK
jgi:hypothetical protein